MMAKPSSLVDFLPLLIFFVISACFIYTRSRRRRGRKAIPPGPPQIPLVGNLFQLGGIFHRTLAKLAQIYGPIMTIKILSKTIVIISSPDLAKELVRKHDHTFTARQVLDSFRALDHHKYSILFLPADKQWRRLRKLCTEQMFSNERLNASQGLRQEKVQQLRDHIYHCCKTGETVNIRAVAFTTALNLMSYTLFSVDFANYDSDASHELQEAIHGAANLLGVLNLVDYYPVLRWFDPQGIRRRTKFHFGKLLQAFDGIISHRLKERDSSKKNDLLAVLLEKYHHGEADWSYNDIKHLILDLIIAGTHTTSATIEWVMAELLHNPEKMERVVQEIRQVIDQSNQIQESDVSRLPYLQAVVKETLRLHPVGGLTGRSPSDDLQIDGYVVPKDAHILVNLWAINRDSAAWTDPDSFVPERFVDSNIDLKGQHFELLPFGSGRRICPGMPFSLRMVHLMVASLLRDFDWKLADAMMPEDMDMTETSGLTAQKALPLKLIPTIC